MDAYRRLEDLTLMDDYMFGTVMQDPKLIRPLIESILNMRIRQVTYIEPQRTVKSGFEAKGVRLDLYVEDENGVVYNVEVQTTRHRSLPKRMRYYQSAIDMNVLSPGADYAKLRKSFIIFICNHDPFGRDRIVYHFENRCIEEPALPFGDETVKVIVNTKGTTGTVNAELQEVIRYLDSGTVSGDFSRELEDAVNHVKSSEERRHEYMIMMLREQELIEQGREQGLVQGLEQGLAQGREQGLVQGLVQGREQGLMQGLVQGREQGLMQGLAQGREQGLVQGLAEGEFRLAKLIETLFSLGRSQDAVRAASDPEYRRQLYSEMEL